MRCLYCGKHLPLLRKLTGGGEFCSDAHRDKYHEEYNRLAVSRLLQAQSRPEDYKPAQKPPETAPVAVAEAEEPELVAVSYVDEFKTSEIAPAASNDRPRLDELEPLLIMTTQVAYPSVELNGPAPACEASFLAIFPQAAAVPNSIAEPEFGPVAGELLAPLFPSEVQSSQPDQQTYMEEYPAAAFVAGPIPQPKNTDPAVFQHPAASIDFAAAPPALPDRRSAASANRLPFKGSIRCSIAVMPPGAGLLNLSPSLDDQDLARFRPIMNLRLALLSETDLKEAELQESEVKRAELDHSDLNKAELSGAELSGAELSGAEPNKAAPNQAEAHEPEPATPPQADAEARRNGAHKVLPSTAAEPATVRETNEETVPEATGAKEKANDVTPRAAFEALSRLKAATSRPASTPPLERKLKPLSIPMSMPPPAVLAAGFDSLPLEMKPQLLRYAAHPLRPKMALGDVIARPNGSQSGLGKKSVDSSRTRSRSMLHLDEDANVPDSETEASSLLGRLGGLFGKKPRGG